MRKWSSSPGYQQQQRVIPAQRITKPSWANDKYNTSIPFHHGLPSSWNFRGFPYVLSTIFECLMVDGCLVNFPTHFSTLRCILPLDPAGLSVAHHHNHQRTIPEERLDAMVIAMVKSITAIPLKKKPPNLLLWCEMCNSCLISGFHMIFKYWSPCCQRSSPLVSLCQASAAWWEPTIAIEVEIEGTAKN